MVQSIKNGVSSLVNLGGFNQAAPVVTTGSTKDMNKLFMDTVERIVRLTKIAEAKENEHRHDAGFKMPVEYDHIAKLVKIIPSFLKQGVDIETRNSEGKTALRLFADIDNTIMVRYLMGKGASTITRDNNNQTPYISAFHKGDDQIYRFMAKDWADQAFNYYYFRQRERTPLTEQIFAKMNIDHQDSFGYSGLMLAAIVGNERIVSEYIHHGANLFLKNDKGMTALDIARGYVKIGGDTNSAVHKKYDSVVALLEIAERDARKQISEKSQVSFQQMSVALG